MTHLGQGSSSSWRPTEQNVEQHQWSHTSRGANEQQQEMSFTGRLPRSAVPQGNNGTVPIHVCTALRLMSLWSPFISQSR